MSTSIRSFLAIDVREPLRSRIGEVVDALRARPNGDRVRWVSSDNLHITLRFLGEVSGNVLPDLVAAVGRAVESIPAFDLNLRDLRVFPTSKSPRVIAIGLEAEGHLTELAAAVENSVVRSGMSAENRGFHAHLTLGRLRGHGYPSLHDDFGLDGATVPVDEVVLFKSDLQPGGAIYTRIEAVGLAANQAARDR